MRKVIFGLLVALAAAVVVVWVMRQQTLAQLQQQSAALAQTQAILEELRAENAKLNASLVETTPSADQLTELLKLRSEVTRLRQQTNEIRRLQAQNAQLMQQRSAGSAIASPATTAKTPPEVAPGDNHPRDTWTFAGYASPDATVQTMLWSMTQTNIEGFLAGFTPEMRAEIEKHIPDNPADMQNEMSKNTGFRVLDRKMISADEMDLTIYLDGDGHTETTRFRQIYGEWKIVK